MALSCGARVLLADEPTTALDVSVQEEILQLIRTLVDERGLAVLLISAHQRGVSRVGNGLHRATTRTFRIRREDQLVPAGLS